MKHIKLFEDKSNEQLISDINDIFLELIDIGFNIIIHPNYDRKNGIYYTIFIKRFNGKLFNCNLIKDSFYMLCDYFDCNNVLYDHIGGIYHDKSTFPDNKYVRRFKIEFITMKRFTKTNKMIVSFSM